MVTLKGCGGIFGELRGYFWLFVRFWYLEDIFGYLETWWIFWILQEGFCYYEDFGRYFCYYWAFLGSWGGGGVGEYFDHFGNFIDVLFSSEDLEYFCHLKISRRIFVILEILSYFDQFWGHMVILVNLAVYKKFCQGF